MNVYKGHYSTLEGFERAKREATYSGVPPVDAKIANMCLEDKVRRLGVGDRATLGTCELSELCSFVNDKALGLSGYCLKQAVGVEVETKISKKPQDQFLG